MTLFASVRSKVNQDIENGNFMMCRRWEEYNELLGPITVDFPKVGFVLDSGCGMGYACRDLSEFHPDLTIVGITNTTYPTVYPVIRQNMEEPLRLAYRVNLALDIYGAISYSCYPILVIYHILNTMPGLEPGSEPDRPKLYIYCTFDGRLNDIHHIITSHQLGIEVDFWDGYSRLVFVKTPLYLGIPEQIRLIKFYAKSYQVCIHGSDP